MESAPQPSIPVSNPSSAVVGLLTALLLANLSSVFLLLKLLPQPEATVIPKWEYKCESVPDTSFERGMNALGEDGWEVVAARRAKGSDDDMSYEMVLKRPKAKK
jgi:hypothetical protein